MSSSSVRNREILGSNLGPASAYFIEFFFSWFSSIPGLAQPQNISRQLPNAVACVRFQISSRGIYGGQIGIGAGFIR
jgi:hypothetical protein